METNLSQLNIHVMRRVRFIYWSKRVYHSATLKIFLLGMCTVSATLYVSLPDVILNMPSLTDLQAFSKFVFSALLNTRSRVQLIAILAISIVLWLCKDIIQNIRENSLMKAQARI